MCTANFQKLQIALLVILVTWAVLAMMCRHEKNQQVPCLEVVGPYGKYCLFRQLVVTRRQRWRMRYLRSDNFTLRTNFTNRFSQSGAPQARQQALGVRKQIDKMPSCEVVPTKKCIFSISPPQNEGTISALMQHRQTCLLLVHSRTGDAPSRREIPV